MKNKQFLAHHNGSSCENSQDILFNEIVLGDAVWDEDMETRNKGWCATPWLEERLRLADITIKLADHYDKKERDIVYIKRTINNI